MIKVTVNKDSMAACNAAHCAARNYTMRDDEPHTAVDIYAVEVNRLVMHLCVTHLQELVNEASAVLAAIDSAPVKPLGPLQGPAGYAPATITLDTGHVVPADAWRAETAALPISWGENSGSPEHRHRVDSLLRAASVAGKRQ